MKLLDLTKCSEDSPSFKRHLEAFEEATVQLEKTLKQILNICEQRSVLAAKDRTLMSCLIGEMESFAHHDLILSESDEPAVQGSIDLAMVTLRQLMDNQERLFEQINLAIVKNVKHFLQNDLAQVKTSKKAYHKSLNEAIHLSEKFNQCKRHESAQMNELSYQLFDARFQIHRAACTYVLDLNALHSKKTPDFLQRVVDLMTSMFSHYHIGNITTKEIMPIVEALYQTLVRIRAEYTARDTERRTQVQSLLEQVLLSRSQDLLLFLKSDLNNSLEVAVSNIKEHLSNNYKSVSYAPTKISLPDQQLTIGRTKSGYLMYSEQRTFGSTWIRLYFTVKRGRLEAPENKAKVPISMSLKLCNVKLAEPTDSERNFCFKVTSPTRILLLQAENSRMLHEWMTTITNAITHSIHNQSVSDVHITLDDKLTTTVDDETTDNERPKSSAAILRELQSIAGNEICADCHSNKPKWASVNLGLLICIECSGIHRSLGVHVSQVRSLTLDTMKPEWENTLHAIGNRKSNAIYEELLPQGYNRSLLKKDDGRTTFIYEKYISMKYTSPQNKERILFEREEKRTTSLAKSKAAAATIINSPVIENKIIIPSVTELHMKDTTAVHIAEGITGVPTEDITAVPTEDITVVPTEDITGVPTEDITTIPTGDITAVPTGDITAVPTGVPTEDITGVPTEDITGVPTEDITGVPTEDITAVPTEDASVHITTYSTGTVAESTVSVVSTVVTELQNGNNKSEQTSCNGKPVPDVKYEPKNEGDISVAVSGTVLQRIGKGLGSVVKLVNKHDVK